MYTLVGLVLQKHHTINNLSWCFLISWLPVRIPLDRVKTQWEQTNGPYHIQRLAEHYGIYQDLFPMAYFVPRVMLRVAYGEDGGAAVHYGNHLTPSQAAQAPRVHFEAEEKSLWTLLLTSPGTSTFLHLYLLNYILRLDICIT
ncbi:39S ribosomal protein L38, mitochondrial-like [Puntigrus tetrazona]|uniref:39S ribosomal protein L38, mitochondrial-like n=1 Tax=Puntigrus tetrazona TaxID=1606681 RepID=UPI001C8AF7BD|nr:39S ribosomal protein L38, mitochondrial-like [Puntigrus tetrazona]